MRSDDVRATRPPGVGQIFPHVHRHMRMANARHRVVKATNLLARKARCNRQRTRRWGAPRSYDSNRAGYARRRPRALAMSHLADAIADRRSKRPRRGKLVFHEPPVAAGRVQPLLHTGRIAWQSCRGSGSSECAWRLEKSLWVTAGRNSPQLPVPRIAVDQESCAAWGPRASGALR
jgi:hypothetical protein